MMSVKESILCASFMLLLSPAAAIADEALAPASAPSAHADSPVSPSTTAKPRPLQETVTKEAPPAQDNSVGSFFQLTPPPKQPSGNKSGLTQIPHSGYRVIWHVLDNLGVPMFFGLDDGMDPGLKRGATIMPLAEPAAKPPAQPGTETPVEKIPENELEGTIYEKPAIKDEQNQKP